MNQFVIYTYDLSKLPSSKKVRFVYLLKGRNGQPGLVKKFCGRFLVPGCFLLPVKFDNEMQQVFKLWSVKPRREVFFQ